MPVKDWNMILVSSDNFEARHRLQRSEQAHVVISDEITTPMPKELDKKKVWRGKVDRRRESWNNADYDIRPISTLRTHLYCLSGNIATLYASVILIPRTQHAWKPSGEEKDGKYF